MLALAAVCKLLGLAADEGMLDEEESVSQELGAEWTDRVCQDKAELHTLKLDLYARNLVLK